MINFYEVTIFTRGSKQNSHKLFVSSVQDIDTIRSLENLEFEYRAEECDSDAAFNGNWNGKVYFDLTNEYYKSFEDLRRDYLIYKLADI